MKVSNWGEMMQIIKLFVYTQKYDGITGLVLSIKSKSIILGMRPKTKWLEYSHLFDSCTQILNGNQ